MYVDISDCLSPCAGDLGGESPHRSKVHLQGTLQVPAGHGSCWQGKVKGHHQQDPSKQTNIFDDHYLTHCTCMFDDLYQTHMPKVQCMSSAFLPNASSVNYILLYIYVYSINSFKCSNSFTYTISVKCHTSIPMDENGHDDKIIV